MTEPCTFDERHRMTDIADMFVVERRPATMAELRGALDRIDTHLANLREASVNDVEWDLTHALMTLAPIIGSILNMLDTPEPAADEVLVKRGDIEHVALSMVDCFSDVEGPILNRLRAAVGKSELVKVGSGPARGWRAP